MATTPIDVALSHSFGFEVLGDALGPGDVLTDAATRGLGVTASTAKRTASPGTLPTGTLPVLNQSSGEAAGGQCWEGWVFIGFIERDFAIQDLGIKDFFLGCVNGRNGPPKHCIYCRWGKIWKNVDKAGNLQ